MRAALDVYGSPRLPPETRHNTGLLLLGDSKHPPLRGKKCFRFGLWLVTFRQRWQLVSEDHRFVRTRQNIADAEHHSEGGLQRKIGAELIAGYTCFTLLGISQHKRREQRPLTASPLTRYEQRSAESGAQEPRSIFMCLLCFVSLREKQDQAVQGVRGASVVEMVVQQEPRASRLRRN
ncbi:unnamed protein product [Gadus morhua 'NCC']